MKNNNSKKIKQNKKSAISNMANTNKSTSKKWKYIIPILLILISVGYYSFSKLLNSKSETINTLSSYEALKDGVDKDSLLLSDTNFINAVTVDNEDEYQLITLSEQNDSLSLSQNNLNSEANNNNYNSTNEIAASVTSASLEPTIDKTAGKRTNTVYNGRRINISIIGLDNRIGTNSNHADANHVISIMPDDGKIEIISIPRDTPADARMPDTSGQNKLTIVRANRGRKSYMKEVTRIARLDRINYYIEFGFSQAMGILELLGFKDRKATLQVLRSRKGLGGDDYQRCYNQGQFIRQILLKHFNKATGTFGDVLIHGALAFVETNLDFSTMKKIVEDLEKNGFADSPDDVTIKVRPALGMKFKQYDLTNKEVLNKLKSKIESYNKWSGESSSKIKNVSNLLWSAIKSAEKDTLKNPKRAIQKLRNYFDQKAWMQVDDLDDRISIRENLARVLSTAYYKRSDGDNARNVLEAIRKEKEMFEKNN